MSYLKKKNRTLVQRLLIGCHNMALLGLALSFMMLSAVVVLSMFYEEIPIPPRLMERIERQLESQGLNLACEKVTLDFRGNLLGQKMALSFMKSDEPVLEADLVYLHINFAALMLDRIPIDKVRVSNATLYCPAMVSPSGATDHLVQDLHFSLRRHWGGWSMPFLTGNFRHLQLSASGDLTGLVLHLSEPGKGDPDKPDLYPVYLKLSGMAMEAYKTLNALHAPHLELEFATPANRQFTVSSRLTAPRFSSTSWPSAEGLTHTGSFQLAPDVRILQPVRIGAQTVTMENPEIRLKNVSIAALKNGPIEDLKSPFPFRFEASTSTLIYRDTPFDNLVIYGSLLDGGKIEGTISGETLQGVLTSHLQADLKSRTARGSVRGHFNGEAIVGRPEFNHLWKLRWSKQHQPAYFDVDFSYPGNLDGLAARIRLETRDVEMIKAPFQWARLRGHLRGTRLDLHQIDVGGNGNDLKCAFQQDLREKFFRFSMAGNFRPHDVNAWWGSWWTETFQHLNIIDQPPYLDLAIRNSFYYKKRLTLHGYAAGEKVELGGMGFDRVASKMFIRPNYIDVFELNAHRPEGSASGQIQCELKGGALQNIRVDATSNLDPEPSLGLFGEGGRKILEPYTWEGHPTLTVRGEFNFSEPTHWQELDIGITTDSPLSYHGFPVDSLEARCRYDRGDVYLDELAFRFAEGSGSGSASYIHQDENAFLLYDFELTGAHLGQALKKVGQFRRNSGADQPSQGRGEKEYKGVLDIQASGISPAGYGLDKVFAQGNVEVRDGTLAEIPLFGPLSGLIFFTKLKLGDASAFFQWDAGKITFPDLVMTGNTARLEGEGEYYPDGSFLDFQVRVILLREAGIPILSQLVMPILDPLSHIAEVNLTGTLTKPQWQFALNPLNPFIPKTIPRPKPLDTIILEYDFDR